MYWKVRNNGRPFRLHQWLNFSNQCPDRTLSSTNIWSKLMESHCEQIPNYTKHKTRVAPFKKKLRKWIIHSVTIHKS